MLVIEKKMKEKPDIIYLTKILPIFSKNLSFLKFTLFFITARTSVAKSREQTSKWNIFPQFATQAPRSY